MSERRASAERLQARGACGCTQKGVEASSVPLERRAGLCVASGSQVDAAATDSRRVEPGSDAAASASPGACAAPIPLSILEHKVPTPCGAEAYDKRGFGLELAGRLNRYGRAKFSNERMAAWLEERAAAELAELVEAGKLVEAGGVRCRMTVEQWRAGSVEVSRAGKLTRCGVALWFRHYFTHPDRPTKLAGGEFCQQRLLCQGCSLVRSAKLVRAYVPKIVGLLDCGAVPMFFSGTARNGEDLAERFGHVERVQRTIVSECNKVRFSGHRHAWGGVVGGVFSFETKRGEGTRGGGWHPHVHGVLLFKRVPSAGEIEGMLGRWCELSGESDIRAQDLRPLHSLAEIGSEAATEAAVSEGVGSDLLEVFKYPLKISALEPADRWAAFRALTRRRLIRPFGWLWGMAPSASAVDEFDAGDLPYVELLFRYASGQGRYDLDGRRLVVPGRRVFSVDTSSTGAYGVGHGSK